ncbi:MAG TPA: MFS transporter [Candidatus Eubacterium faecavium]|nr:MFS transporter [Candidatus Eubacterium faecavium]
MAEKSSLTKKKKTGYAFGIFTESLIYNMFYTYYLTFLIEIAGIKPAFSSIIIFISIAWDAVTDPMIGNYTDRPGVDKRRVMKMALVPLGLVFIVAWTSIGAGLSSQLAKILLYTFITMCLWVFYTMYTIPYYAVVAELTEDYDERTEIRSLSSLLSAVAVGLGNILPALVPTVAVLLTSRFESNAYAVVAAIISVMAVIFGFVCCKSLEGVYHPKAAVAGATGGTIRDTFKSFGEILRLKPAKYFLAFVFFFLATSSMIQSNLTYMVIDCIGMDYDTGIVAVIISLVVSMAVVVPVVEKVAHKKDRRYAAILFLSIACAGEVLLKIIGLDAEIGGFRIMCVIAPAVLGIGTGTFWTLFYSMGYDLVELDEFKTGQRRESTITALPQLVQKFGSAFGILMAGVLLGAYGYDSSGDIAGSESLIQQVTDPKIVNGMENISTIIPAGLLLISIIFAVLYPMTRERFNALMAQLKKKRNGEEYTTEGFEKLL